MKRNSINFFIDLIALIALLGLLFTSIIIRYILPPGTGGLGRHLHGGFGREAVKTLWSMTRHQWGDIHFYFATAFIILMLLHIFLHWTWIKNTTMALLNRPKK